MATIFRAPVGSGEAKGSGWGWGDWMDSIVLSSVSAADQSPRDQCSIPHGWCHWAQLFWALLIARASSLDSYNCSVMEDRPMLLSPFRCGNWPFSCQDWCQWGTQLLLESSLLNSLIAFIHIFLFVRWCIRGNEYTNYQNLGTGLFYGSNKSLKYLKHFSFCLKLE